MALLPQMGLPGRCVRHRSRDGQRQCAPEQRALVVGRRLTQLFLASHKSCFNAKLSTGFYAAQRVAAVWIQAMVHDWIGHYDAEEEVTLDKGNGCPLKSFSFKKTKVSQYGKDFYE
jgi:hypothetical protein